MTPRPHGTGLPTAFLSVLMYGSVMAIQLPPEIQADRHLVRAERAIDEQDFLGAKVAMDAILELQAQHDLELPEAFSFRYAEVLERLGLYDEAVYHVTAYLAAAGRDGEYYREALELLDSAEETSRRLGIERELADAARRQAEEEQKEADDLVRRQIEDARIALPRDQLRSGGVAPEMVRIASGRFQYFTYQDLRSNLHWVEFQRPFAISKYEVTRGEFERFVERSRYRTEARRDPEYGCSNNAYPWNGLGARSRLRWNRPGFDQGDTHPVTCVSIGDAMAFAEWLSGETGQTYRLPSAAEWQYAARAGSTAAMLYEERAEDAEQDDPKACRSGNVQDTSTDDDWQDNPGWFFGYKCSDGVKHTAEVGRFPPNDVGVYDTIGNVSELVLACNNVRDSFFRLSPDGSPETPASCEYVAALGVSWNSHYVDGYDYRGVVGVPATPHRDGEWYKLSSSNFVGFRIVRELDEDPVTR